MSFTAISLRKEFTLLLFPCYSWRCLLVFWSFIKTLTSYLFCLLQRWDNYFTIVSSITEWNKILNNTRSFKILTTELLEIEKCQFQQCKSALRLQISVVSHSYCQHSESDYTKGGKNYKEKLKESFKNIDSFISSTTWRSPHFEGGSYNANTEFQLFFGTFIL